MDIVGYGRLMTEDEAATVDQLKQHRTDVSQVIERHKGRIVNAPGDNILAEFASAVEAVQAGIEIQRTTESRNALLPDERRMRLRIGINLGDIIEEDDGSIYGDGVNIAARLEAIADEGGICVSGTTFDAVDGKLASQFDFLGEQRVKNIPKPVRVYRVLSDSAGRITASRSPKKWKPALIVVVGVCVALLGGFGIWWVASEDARNALNVTTDNEYLKLPGGPAVAVLPFENISGDSEQDYFSDGITEEIIAELARFDELYVIARNSTFQYKGKATDIRSIGADLGAQFAVVGSVRKLGNQVRVTASLVDARTGANLWVETYDKELSAANILDVQREITSHVVSAIADAYGVIRISQMNDFKRSRTADLGAYECVLRAHEYYRIDFTPKKHLEVRACLEEAIKRDPDYAVAWTWLAGIHRDEYLYGFNTRPNALEASKRAAERAIQLEPSSQAAHAFLADVFYHQGRKEAFLAEAERAISINPNSANVLNWMALKFVTAGNPNLGVALARKSLALNRNPPLWFWTPQLLDHFMKGEFDQAAEYAEKWDLPGFFWSPAWRAACHGQAGELRQANADIEDLLKIYPEFAANARSEFRKWFALDDGTLEESFIAGLRKAGLDVPNAPG